MYCTTYFTTLLQHSASYWLTNNPSTHRHQPVVLIFERDQLAAALDRRIVAGPEDVGRPAGLRPEAVVDLLAVGGDRQQQESDRGEPASVHRVVDHGTRTVSPGCSSTFVPGALPATKAS